MKMFKWSACLSNGQSYEAVLKEKEEDFIVREIGGDGSLLNITGNILEEFAELEKLPMIEEKHLCKAGKKEEIKQVQKILGRVTGIQTKEERRLVHSVYSMHPYVYTKALATADKSLDVLVVYDTNHTQHTYAVTLTKKGKTTSEAVDTVAKLLRIPSGSVKYAGNKDKRGITTQLITVENVSFNDLYEVCQTGKELKRKESKPLPEKFSGREVPASVLPEGVKTVLFSDISAQLTEIQHKVSTRKAKEQSDKEYLATAEAMKDSLLLSSISRKEANLKLGELRGNRFYLKLKTEASSEVVAESVEALKTNGFPNYYGMQRFGHTMSNPTVGKYILNRKYKEAIDTIVESLRGLEGSPNMARALAHIEKKEYLQASNELPGKYHVEKNILRGLQKKVPARTLFQMIRRENRLLYLHSYQSMLFNDALEEKLASGACEREYTTSQPWVGSITSEKDIENQISVESKPALQKIAIPLFPKALLDKPNPSAEKAKGLIKGGYRKAVIIPRNVSYGVKQGVLSLSFELPPGTYATMVIKEITKNGTKEIAW
ncbi:tRNA pseudouridine13 synthase [Nematocida sp. AWRm77]|nr:tRNA pseudouridine13 synthase [Nematocida sp. AWRm77]